MSGFKSIYNDGKIKTRPTIVVLGVHWNSTQIMPRIWKKLSAKICYLAAMNLNIIQPYLSICLCLLQEKSNKTRTTSAACCEQTPTPTGLNPGVVLPLAGLFKDLRKLITPQSSQSFISHSPLIRIKRLSNLLPAGSGASKVHNAEINRRPYGQLLWLKNYVVINMGSEENMHRTGKLILKPNNSICFKGQKCLFSLLYCLKHFSWR